MCGLTHTRFIKKALSGAFLLLSITPFASVVIAGPGQSAKARHATTTRKNAPVFVFQDNFWVNLNHFLRVEAWRRARGIPLELSVAALKPSARAEWESALTTYTDLAKRSFIFDETPTQIDNVLAMESGLIISSKTAINPKFVMALNRISPIYSQHRWHKDHLENRQWIATHAPSITEHAPRIQVAIGKVFGIAPQTNPILVDVVRDIGLNLAYTTQGPVGFSGHTLISAQANSDPNVALDTILHEISHTIDDPIIAIINAEAARQHIRIPSDLWHAMTLYTTGELVRRELGRSRSDPTYGPNSAFLKMYAEGAWHSMIWRRAGCPI